MPEENKENKIELEELNQNEGEGGRILKLPLVGEIKTSYLNYAMSVIVGRALPDARDGLKPVQRRVLYAMSELGLKHNTAYKKSARIVGETMGKYHPHGDSSIYDTMVRLAQSWNLRYPLVDGQGNFGSVDGDSAAAMRYTEARLSWLGELMLSNIDEDTIDWGMNFDESLKEPLTLPCIMPNLLVNGATGIAVGMATNIPPHNLREVVNILCWCIENEIEPEQATLEQIMKYLPGPDFPTGGEIAGNAGIIEAYSTGRGKIIVRGKTHVEESKRGKESIIITEIPYAVNKTLLLEAMVTAVQNKEIEGVSEIRDESDRDGLRIVIELQRDADADFITRQLYKRTQLQTTFGVINLALVDKHPVILNINKMLSLYLNYRRDVVRRRTEYRLKQAQGREHIIEGLKKALENIETVIKIIRANNSAPEAKAALQIDLGFSDGQAQAILDMRLQRLTGLERNRLDEEQKKLLADIASYKNILADKKVLDGVIKDELQELASRFGDDRRTELGRELDDMPDEAFIQEEDIVITLSKDGFIKRLPLEFYKTQGRGGKGRKGSGVREDDSIELLCVTHTHRQIFFFTNLGRMISVKGYEITETKSGKGKLISKFLPLLENEKIVNIGSEDSGSWKFAFFITRLGIAKRVAMEELESSNRPRKIMNLDEGDEIARVCLTTGTSDLLLISKNAQALRVSEEEFRPLSRNARGVTAMKLKDGDKILSCDVVDDDRKIFVLSENGIGKRTEFSSFTAHHRATGGVLIMDLSERTGSLSASIALNENDDIIVITSKGRSIRVAASEIRTLRRTAQGSKVLSLDEGDSVADCSVVRGNDENETKDIPFEENNEEDNENYENENS